MSAPRINLLLTRPDGTNGDLVSALAPDVRELLELVEAPLIEIVPIAFDLVLATGEAALFTSANGVRFGPASNGKKAFCLGSSTTRTAVEAGWNAIRCGQDADSLVQEMLKQAPEQKLVHFHGTHTRGQVVRRLRNGGLNVDACVVYDQKLVPLTAAALSKFNDKTLVLVPLYSPRTAMQFSDQCPNLAAVHVIALSQAVAEQVAQRNPASVVVSSEPSQHGMVRAIENLVRRLALG